VRSEESDAEALERATLGHCSDESASDVRPLPSEGGERALMRESDAEALMRALDSLGASDVRPLPSDAERERC
jgi:hypothetical protein